jgi:transcription factor SFP1
MNGLRYHYQHSGDHGALGLALLSSGRHECLGGGRRSAAAASSSGSMSVSASRDGSLSVGNSRTGTPQPFGLGLGVDVKPEVSGLAPSTAPVGG